MNDLFERPAERRTLPGGAGLHLGTSGYSFPHWRGHFYPDRIRKSDHLRYYAMHFNSLEINSTYYRILKPASTAAMARGVPEGFSFSVKLHSSMTHSRDAGGEEWKDFHRMLIPLRERGMMGMILAQFPWSFPLQEKSFRWLKQVAENLGDLPAAAEFRHERWYESEPLERVVEMGFTPVSVDLPELRDLPKTGILDGGNAVYLRLHGRNTLKWWGNTQERYDYLYDEGELVTWAERLNSLSGPEKNCYVFFNNCHMGKAALNAKDMEKLLGGVQEADE